MSRQKWFNVFGRNCHSEFGMFIIQPDDYAEERAVLRQQRAAAMSGMKAGTDEQDPIARSIHAFTGENAFD